MLLIYGLRGNLTMKPTSTPKTAFTLKKVSRLNRLKSKGDAVRELYIQPIVNKTRKRRRKRRVKKVKDVSEWCPRMEKIVTR